MCMKHLLPLLPSLAAWGTAPIAIAFEVSKAAEGDAADERIAESATQPGAAAACVATRVRPPIAVQ